jgi:hypothetical protein
MVAGIHLVKGCDSLFSEGGQGDDERLAQGGRIVVRF